MIKIMEKLSLKYLWSAIKAKQYRAITYSKKQIRESLCIQELQKMQMKPYLTLWVKESLYHHFSQNFSSLR